VRAAGDGVPEGDLDWGALLADDDAAEMPVVLAGEQSRRVETA
jgi:hypothetical protein